MSDTFTANNQQLNASSHATEEDSVSHMKSPVIKDSTQEEQSNSSRVGILRRDTLDDKSTISRRSSIDTLKAASKKRMSMNMGSTSPSAQARRLSKFKEASEALHKVVAGAPDQFSRKTTLKRKSTLKKNTTLRASPRDKAKEKGGRRSLRARSTKELQDPSVGSRSLSDLEDIHDLYHHQKTRNELPMSIALGDASPTTKKVVMNNRVKQMYYQMMRKKLKKGTSQPYPNTGEFLEQIQEAKDNIRTPNVDRIRDLVIVDQDPLEKLRSYQDKYPLLKFRKLVLQIKKTIAIMASKIISHPIFEYFILLVIVINSVILALDDPTVPGTLSDGVDNALLAIYTMEATLKILGQGFFFNKGAYLRDAWNIIDFVIVVTSYIPIVLGSEGLNLQAFRALRVLRPLRTISNIEALRILISTLVGAFGPLLETLFILFFVFLIFAIGGLQLFSGLLKKRCFAAYTGIPLYDETEDATENEKFCNTDDDCGIIDGVAYVCGKMVKNPNYDITNFDTLQNSFLMVFQSVTLEGWSDIMIYLEKTFTKLAAFYFVILILICSFFLLNLTLAVLKVKFTEQNTEQVKEKDLNEKYYAHGEKFFIKLEDNKKEVLSLMEKRKQNEISYNKYEFKKNNLVAVGAEKNLRTGVTLRRRRANPNSKANWLITKLQNNPVKKGFTALVSLAQRMRSNSSQDDGTKPKKIAQIHPAKTIDTTATSTPIILVTAKTKSLKAEVKNETQPTTPTENFNTGNSATKPLLKNSPISPDPKNDLNSPMKAIEMRNSPDISKTPSLMVIPSIAEANEKSEQSVGTLGALTSKNFLAVRRNNFMSNNLKVTSPIRPALGEKIRVRTDSDDKSNGVAMINIAGIRNKSQQKAHPKLLTHGSYQFDITPVPDSEEVPFNDELTVFDLLDSRSPISHQADIRPIQGQNLIVKQINQIRKVEQPKIRKSGFSVQPRQSQRVTSISDLGEEEELNKQGLAVAPTGILDDSDFFDEHQRKDLIRVKRQEKAARRRLNGGRSPTKKRTYNTLTSFKNLPEGRTKGESHTRVGGKKLTGSLEGDRFSMNKLGGHAEEEDNEQYIIDVRYLKAVPAFERDYRSTCDDDVLPSKKEKELQRIEDEENEQLRKTRLKLKFKITTADERKAKDRLESRYSRSSGASSLLGANSKSRRHRTDESRMDSQYSKNNTEKDLETSYSKNRTSTKNHSRKTYNNFSTGGRPGRGNRGPVGNVIGKDDDYIKPEKMNDFIEILTRIDKPFDNEVGTNDPNYESSQLKEFKPADDYRAIRRADLTASKIEDQNWSGDNVLNYTNAHFPVNRAKVALNIQDFDIWQPGYWGVIHWFRRTTRLGVETNIFNNIIMASVFFNTLILATEGLINDQGTADLLSSFNLSFTIIFTIEMGLKLIGYGIIGYVNDKMNLFDAAVVIISLVELTLLSGGGSKAVSAFRTIRLFRTFRVLRVTKLLRSLRYMQLIITVIGRSMKKFIYIFVLLFLFIFIYTLLGMQLFGGGLNLSDNTGRDRTRQNFDTFMNAFMTVFQIMTQENWQQILFLAIRSEYVNTMISIGYLVSWIWIGNYIFLNLFLAILLDEFTTDDVSDEYDELDTEDDGGDTFTLSRGQTLNRSGRHGTQRSERTLSNGSSHNVFRSMNSRTSEDIPDDGESAKHIKDHKTQIMVCEKSLYFIHKDNIIRKTCLKIIQHPYFDRMILTMIVLSSIKLAFDTYFDDTDNPIIQVSDKVDDAINIFFAIEAGLKIISLGFFMDDGCYLRDAWNKLDMVIVIASILDMSIEAVNLSFIRILRLLRTLRPLRFITHNQNMRLVVTALIESFGAILNVILVVLLIWLMFGILAVNIVGSKLGYCDNLPEDVNYYGVGIQRCAQVGGTWTNPLVNFDNVFQSIMALFILSTQENWPDIMYTVVDSNDASEGPLEGNQRLFAYLYFVVFMFVGSLFLVNLFIGVILLEFQRAQKRENHLKKFLTTEQQNWVIMQRLIILAKPDLSNVEPKNDIMKKVFRVINSTKFEVGIMIIIVFNILLMGITYEGSSDDYNQVLKYINWCFSGIFMVEMILKHIGYGFWRYWANPWNKFDAFVVIASVFDILTDILQQSFFSFIRIGPQLARVFRVLRVSRLLKLIKQFEGLQKILNTLLFTLPALLNVGALLFLVFFIYSILATYIFKDVKGGANINEYVHFQDFGTAILNLFRCSTGENWWVIMYDTIYPTLCNDGTANCGTWAAYPFWLSFIVVCQFIFLNLFILVVLQQFEDYHLNDDNPVNTFATVMENQIKSTWEEFSLKHGGTHIHINQLADFFSKIPSPYGFKGSTLPRIEKSKQLMHLNIPQDFNNMFYYNDIIFATFKLGFTNKQTEEPLPIQHQYIAINEEKTRQKLEGLKKSIVLPGGGLRRKSTTAKGTVKSKKFVGANPLPRILFMGMTMRAWAQYAHKKVEKMKAAEDNELEYIESESDQNDYTFEKSEESVSDQSPSDSASDYDDEDDYVESITEEQEAELDEIDEGNEDNEEDRVNTEQESLIDMGNSERKLTGDVKVKEYALDEEADEPYNVTSMNHKGLTTQGNRKQGGTKLTITSHSSIRGGSHVDFDKNRSSQPRIGSHKLVKFAEVSDDGDDYEQEL